MNIEELREYCLSKKSVKETMPFDRVTLVYKVMGKAFLLAGMEHNPAEFNVKCDPDKAIELREKFPCVQPGYHMNKKHWNTVIADGSVSKKQLCEWIDNSYELVVEGLSKMSRKKLRR